MVPVMCQICGLRPAVFAQKRNIDGVFVTVPICHFCSEQMIIESKLTSVASLLAALNDTPDQSVAHIKCPTCGTSVESFRSTLFVGCADCYRAFGSFVNAALRPVQGALTHRGRTLSASQNNVASERERLREELRRAVAEERYEDASILHERLRAMDEEGQE